MLEGENLVFVTGKGGVGKTTFSLALSISLSRKGKNVLFMEWGRNNQSSLYFKKKIKPYERKKINERLSVFRIEPQKAMEEYVRRRLKSPLLYYPFLKSKIWKGFSNTIPALRESVVIGKIWDIIYGEGAFENINVCVFDGPSTGTAKGMLQIPYKMKEAFVLGPLKKEAQKLIDLIDSDKTLYAVVTYGEELAVDEALDFINFIRPRKFLVVFNRIYEFEGLEKFMPEKNLERRLKEYYLFRKRISDAQLKRLEGLPVIKVPNVFETNDFSEIVMKISKKIEEVLNGKS